MFDLIKSLSGDLSVLERWLDPGNLVLEGLGQDVVNLASSRKYGPGWFGSGTGRFDEALKSEICFFWNGCQCLSFSNFQNALPIRMLTHFFNSCLLFHNP